MDNVIFNIVNYDTNIKGYWKDNTGKISIDNIELFRPKSAWEFENKIDTLFLKGEKAVFVIGKDNAFVLLANGNIETLKERILFEGIYDLTNEYIEKLLKKYNGFTYYKKEGIVETWI